MTDATSPTPLETYWRQGAQIVQACLDKADRCASHAHQAFLEAPIGLTAEQAQLWHRAQAEAYRHALEMMAPPEEASDALVERTNESVAKLLAAA